MAPIFEQVIAERLAEDRVLIAETYAAARPGVEAARPGVEAARPGVATAGPGVATAAAGAPPGTGEGVAHAEAPLILCQQVPLDQFRLPEYFRGDPEAAIAIVGPHAPLLPEEPAPLYGAGLQAYLDFYRTEVPARPPFYHYRAICGERRWLALEMPPWKAPKELNQQVLKGPERQVVADRSLCLIWRLLAATPVRILVLSGADVMKWTWGPLGLPGQPPAATWGHGRVQGAFPLPGAPGRQVHVVTSFHWGPEVPLFCRMTPGLKGLSPREAIVQARRMLAEALT